MSRADQLRATLARSRDRADYCRREFDRFCAAADLTKADQQRQHRKLKADWDRAARDVEWAEAQLERALTE